MHGWNGSLGRITQYWQILRLNGRRRWLRESSLRRLRPQGLGRGWLADAAADIFGRNEVGFGDHALRRAEAVRKAVFDAVATPGDPQVEMVVEAFGEALPMACDDSDWGRQVNRRVEVWVR